MLTGALAFAAPNYPQRSPPAVVRGDAVRMLRLSLNPWVGSLFHRGQRDVSFPSVVALHNPCTCLSLLFSLYLVSDTSLI